MIAYAAGRFSTVVFDNVRNIVFERVGQDAVRALTEDVFARLHRLSLRFHLSRRTGEVTKVVERGSKSINTMIYFLLFNIAPTVVEMVVVAAIFYFKFGWEMVARHRGRRSSPTSGSRARSPSGAPSCARR